MFIKTALSLLSFSLFCVTANANPITPFSYSIGFGTKTDTPIYTGGGHAGGSITPVAVYNKSVLPDILLGNVDSPFFQDGHLSLNMGDIRPGPNNRTYSTITSVGPVITDPTRADAIPVIDLFRTFSGKLYDPSVQEVIADFIVNWHYNGHLASEDIFSPNFRLSGMLDMDQFCSFPPCSGPTSLYPNQIAEFSPFPIFSDKFYTTLTLKYNDNAPIGFKGVNYIYSTQFPNAQPMTFEVTNNQLGGQDKYNNNFAFTATMNSLVITVPEPNSLILVGSALALLYLFNRRKKMARLNPTMLV